MITIHIYYTGEGNNARLFAEEMMREDVVSAIRKEDGNLQYEYFFPMEDEHTVLLIDCWENQKALDRHHDSPMMQTIVQLREKYDLRMKVERFEQQTASTEHDRKYIRE